jgi:hypothetical protein
MALSAPQAFATDLNIPPVLQQTPEWCWAASGQMVLEYYGFPNLNPSGDYQCGVVGAQGGQCFWHCAACLNGGGTSANMAMIYISYARMARDRTGYVNGNFRPSLHGILSPSEIMETIDNGSPIVAGITPQGIPYPPGLGISQHAVVISGYEGDENDLQLIINDPFPYYPVMPVPYLQLGGQAIENGKYEIAYRQFVYYLRYGNSITFD